MRKVLISVCNDGASSLVAKVIFVQPPMCAKFQKKLRNNIVIITGAKRENQFLLVALKSFSSNEFNTTETELIAIANAANSGLSVNHIHANAPQAIGIPRVL
jgi:hypothetical protein